MQNILINIVASPLGLLMLIYWLSKQSSQKPLYWVIALTISIGCFLMGSFAKTQQLEPAYYDGIIYGGIAGIVVCMILFIRYVFVVAEEK